MNLSGKERSGQDGTIIVITLLLLVALSLSSLMAVNMALSDSSVLRNSRNYCRDLYQAETGITLAEESYGGSWLAPDSDLFNLSLDDAAVIAKDFSITGMDGKSMSPMGSYEIARIESNPAAGSLSEKFYALSHQAPMPIGSGFSAMNFEIRRYGIRSTGISGSGDGVTVEAGLYKIFNRF